MSQTTAAGSSPASNGTAAAQNAQNAHHAVKPRPGSEAGSDLFSSLLSLLASTTQAADDDPTGNVLTDTALTDSTEASTTTAPQDNPLAGLLATLPGWAHATLKTAPAAARGSDAADRAGAAPTLAAPGRIDGATPLTAEARALLQPLEPGAARERGMEARVERSVHSDKARPAMAATTLAAQTHATGGPGRGTEQIPGLTWVRAGSNGSTGETTAQALAGSRPTVALDDRFAGTPAPTWSAVARREAGLEDDIRPGEAVGPRSASGASAADGDVGIHAAGGAGGAGNGATGDGSLNGDSGHGSTAGGQGTNRDDSTQPWAAAADDTEVTHWGAGHVRHASLRVGGDGDDAIDIRLQMQGQEVQVGFATDDAQTRELLREQAPQVLGELLGRSGVELGGVSVGAQGQPGQNAGSGGSAQPSTGIERTGRSGRTEAAAGPVLQPLQPKTDGNRPLDVFA